MQEPLNKHEVIDNSKQYDIAIVGGGMVGMALACSLASTPLTRHLNVAIIDSNPALQNADLLKKEGPPDPRVSTVTPATISFYRDMGAWQHVQQHRHAFFDKMQVSNALVSLNNPFKFCQRTCKPYYEILIHRYLDIQFRCVVENKVLHGSLLSSIQSMDFKKRIYPTKLSSMTVNSSSPLTTSAGTASQPCGGAAQLELSNGDSLYAKLVPCCVSQVGADGSKSRVRELAGIETTGWKYSQSAIICTVEHAEQNHCAWQRFLPNGPIALLPIGDNFSNIVWTMDPKESSERISASENDFVNMVNHALDQGYGPRPKSQPFGSAGLLSWLRPGITSSANERFEVPPRVIKLSSARMVFPLSLMHANSYASKRVVLIGDAAHTVHPLAGQGVNMGFGDAIALSKVIAEGVAVGSDIGEVSVLKKYESERKPANIAMMAVLDGFQKAYSVDFMPVNLLRAAAFQAAHYVSPLKRNIISFASGEHKIPLFT
nr:FAD/NAD(P)-binding oxidoreductase family protein [Ipomoea batatas]